MRRLCGRRRRLRGASCRFGDPERRPDDRAWCVRDWDGELHGFSGERCDLGGWAWGSSVLET